MRSKPMQQKLFNKNKTIEYTLTVPEIPIPVNHTRFGQVYNPAKITKGYQIKGNKTFADPAKLDKFNTRLRQIFINLKLRYSDIPYPFIEYGYKKTMYKTKHERTYLNDMGETLTKSPVNGITLTVTIQ